MIDSLSPAVSAGAWAHALIAHADPREEIVAYGDPQELLVGVGTRAYLAIGSDGVIHRSRRLPDTGDPWSAIERFLDQADGKPVLGHLGSDLHRLGEPRLRGSASARFVHDRKILAAHETSLTAWCSCLARLGPVNDIETTVLDLPRLRHRMTVLRVRPDQASLAAVLRATLPPPCSLPSGLALVAEVEPFPRGAYYGLVGLIQPEPGRIALSQVLRTVFRWQGTTYASPALR